MIQIGTGPSPAFRNAPPPVSSQGPAPDEAADDRIPSAEEADGPLFVSPPPLPFPRIFPGL
jgi:hypothetical protein